MSSFCVCARAHTALDNPNDHAGTGHAAVAAAALLLADLASCWGLQAGAAASKLRLGHTQAWWACALSQCLGADSTMSLVAGACCWSLPPPLSLGVALRPLLMMA